MAKKLILLILCVVPLMFAKQHIINQTYISKYYSVEKLVPGVPSALSGIKYFSQQNKFSYAIIYCEHADSIYFVHKDSDLNYNTNLLVITSNSIMRKFKYLIFKKTKNNKLFSSVILKIPDGKSLNIKLYFLPDKYIILSQIKKHTISQEEPFNSIAKFKSEYNIHLIIGVRDEMFYMPGFRSFSGIQPRNLNLAIGIGLLKIVEVYIKLGLMEIYNNLGGADLGIFLKLNLFLKNIYASIGLDNSSIFGQVPYGLNDSNNGGGSMEFLCIGAGYNISKHFELDAWYYIPRNRIIVGNDSGLKNLEQLNRGFIGIGFQYSFIF